MWYFALQNQRQRAAKLIIPSLVKEREENGGHGSKMGYSTPYENKVARKSSEVHLQNHLEVLEIWDLQGKIQSPPASIVMMSL